MGSLLQVLLTLSVLQVGCGSYAHLRDARAIFSGSLPHSISRRDIANPETDSHAKASAGAAHINAISDGEDKDSDELGADYDFVLNLDEKEDFDRLLTLLSRSGPAKHSDEAHVGVSSTFIDRHDELHEDFPRPENSVFDQIAADHPEHASRTQDDSPEVVDPEKQKMEAEQKKLEALYFKNFEMNEQPHGERVGFVLAGASAPSVAISAILPSIFVALKCYALVARM